MASAAADVDFETLTPTQLRQWVENHPGHIEDLDCDGYTAITVAALNGNLTRVQWLLDTHGADVNGRSSDGRTALYVAATPLIVRALLERNADPTLRSNDGCTALMEQVGLGRHECVTCLLEDRRVVILINAAATDDWVRGYTALHLACFTGEMSKWNKRANRPTMLRHLLTAGADPCKPNAQGRTPLRLLRESHATVNKAAVAVLKEGLDAKRAACLIMIRRMVMKRQEVTLGEEERTAQEEEEARMLAAVVGLGGEGGLATGPLYGAD